MVVMRDHQKCQNINVYSHLSQVMILNLYGVTFLYTKNSTFSNIAILDIIRKDSLWRLRIGYKHGTDLSILRRYLRRYI